MTLGEFREKTKRMSDHAELKLSIDKNKLQFDEGKVESVGNYIRPQRGHDIEIVTLKNY